MSSILVTGGAGFIGSALIRMLARESNHVVINADKLTYAGNLESLADVKKGPHYRFYHVDICDSIAIRRILRENTPDAIVHLAAESHVDRSIDAPAEFINTNVVGTFTLLEESLIYWRSLPADGRAAFRFVHVSTDEVFGSLGPHGYFTEETPYRPNSPYSASKAGSDHLVRAWFHTYGFPAITTNCSNNYGPYQFPEKLIPLMIQNALKGKKLPVYGRGENIRDWLYVDDHCRALRRVMERGIPGESYNIGGFNEWRNIDVVELICDLTDQLAPDSEKQARRNLIEFVDDRPGHDMRYAIDPSKIKKDLDWEPLETFATGLQRTIEWYMSNQEWCERVQTGEYRGERLGRGSER